jgi:hypothetical protein
VKTYAVILGAMCLLMLVGDLFDLIDGHWVNPRQFSTGGKRIAECAIATAFLISLVVYFGIVLFGRS